MYLRLVFIPIWPDWEDVEKTMPKSFKAEYPNTFAIIDATELKCEVPSSLSLCNRSIIQHTNLTPLISV